MSTVRVLPLGAPVAAGIGMGGDVGVVLLAAVALVALLLAGRAALFHLTADPADADEPSEPDDGAHGRRR